MSDSYDKTSRLQIANEDLEQGKFKKTNSNKIAVRIGNEEDSPIHTSPINNLFEDLLVFDDTANVAKDTETKLIEYIVAPATTVYLDKVSVSGQNIGKYTLKINEATKKTLRTYYGNSLNGCFEFNNFKLNAGDKLEVFVLTEVNETPSDHEVTIEGKKTI